LGEPPSSVYWGARLFPDAAVGPDMWTGPSAAWFEATADATLGRVPHAAASAAQQIASVDLPEWIKAAAVGLPDRLQTLPARLHAMLTLTAQLASTSSGPAMGVAGAAALACWAMWRGFQEGRTQTRNLRNINRWTVPFLMSLVGAGVQCYAVARAAHHPALGGFAQIALQIPLHVVLIGPQLILAGTCWVWYNALPHRRFDATYKGCLATAAATVASWLVMGFVGSFVALLRSRASTPGAETVPAVRWVLAVLAWAYVDWRNSAGPSRVLPITHLAHQCSQIRITTLLAHCAQDENYEYNGRAFRPHWTRAYSLVSTAVAIVVAVKTGGDPHSAALAKTGSMVALGLLHHVGRTVAQSLLPPLEM
jgi:hypothetical protein